MTSEGAGFPLGVGETGLGQDGEYIRVATGNILALATMALHRCRHFALKTVPDFAAVASAVNIHVNPR